MAMMKKLPIQDSISFPGKRTASAECWFDDACILDMDYFVKTISGIKAKGVRPDLIGSIIVHYASKWLPELSSDDNGNSLPSLEESSAESVTASWMKKRFFVETLVGMLPPERDAIPCNFLLRLLRTANMVGVEPTHRGQVEKRISLQLEQASLKELMIPSFSHTVGTVLDVELVLRLVKRFGGLDDGFRSGVALVKVAKLVDSYLAEVAMDVNLRLDEFIALAEALPAHARAIDDGIYRAVDTYLKVHTGVSKQDRKVMCRLIDSRKLTPEACIHAAQNERLPVRAVIQVLLSEQAKLIRQIDWSGSFSGTRSPGLGLGCTSKREMSAQKMEIKKLKEEVLRVQSHCIAMQMQMEKILDKKKGFFRWRKLGIMPSLKTTVSVFEEEGRDARKMLTSMDVKAKLVRGRTPKYRRKSMS